MALYSGLIPAALIIGHHFAISACCRASNASASAGPGKRRPVQDAPAIVHNLGNPIRRDTNGLCELALRKTMLGEEFILQHFAGLRRCKFVLRQSRLLSMAIHDPDLAGLAFDPFEDHAIDRLSGWSAVLAIALELLQPIRRRYRQVFQPAIPSSFLGGFDDYAALE